MGGGVAYNDWDGSVVENSIGWQLFAGYDLDLDLVEKMGTAVEIGLWSSGDTELKSCPGGSCDVDGETGMWINAVVDYPVIDKVSAAARLGLDIGGDDGLMIGIGAGYDVKSNITIRGEYVIRDDINGFQLNAFYHF